MFHPYIFRYSLCKVFLKEVDTMTQQNSIEERQKRNQKHALQTQSIHDQLIEQEQWQKRQMQELSALESALREKRQHNEKSDYDYDIDTQKIQETQKPLEDEMSVGFDNLGDDNKAPKEMTNPDTEKLLEKNVSPNVKEALEAKPLTRDISPDNFLEKHFEFFPPGSTQAAEALFRNIGTQPLENIKKVVNALALNSHTFHKSINIFDIGDACVTVSVKDIHGNVTNVPLKEVKEHGLDSIDIDDVHITPSLALKGLIPPCSLSQEKQEALCRKYDTQGLQRKLTDIMVKYRETEYDVLSRPDSTAKDGVRAGSEKMIKAMNMLMSQEGLFPALFSPNKEEAYWALQETMKVWGNAVADYESQNNRMINKLDRETLEKKAKADETLFKEMSSIAHSSFNSMSDPQMMLAMFIVACVCPPLAMGLMAPHVIPAMVAPMAAKSVKRGKEKISNIEVLRRSVKAKDMSSSASAMAMLSTILPLMQAGVPPSDMRKYINGQINNYQKLQSAIEGHIHKAYAGLAQSLEANGKTLKLNSPAYHDFVSTLCSMGQETVKIVLGVSNVDEEGNAEIAGLHIKTLDSIGKIADLSGKVNFFDAHVTLHDIEGEQDSKDTPPYSLSDVHFEFTQRSPEEILSEISKKGKIDPSDKVIIDDMAHDANEYIKNLNSMVNLGIYSSWKRWDQYQRDNTPCPSHIIQNMLSSTQEIHKNDSTGSSNPEITSQNYNKYGIIENGSGLQVGKMADIRVSTIVSLFKSLRNTQEQINDIAQNEEFRKALQGERHKMRKAQGDGNEEDFIDFAHNPHTTAHFVQDTLLGSVVADLAMRSVPQEGWAVLQKIDKQYLPKIEAINTAIEKSKNEEERKTMVQFKEYQRKYCESVKQFKTAEMLMNVAEKEARIRLRSGEDTEPTLLEEIALSQAYGLLNAAHGNITDAKKISIQFLEPSVKGHYPMYTQEQDIQTQIKNLQDSKMMRDLFKDEPAYARLHTLEGKTECENSFMRKIYDKMKHLSDPDQEACLLAEAQSITAAANQTGLNGIGMDIMSLTMGVETYFEVQNLLNTEDPDVSHTQEGKDVVEVTEVDNSFDFSPNSFMQGIQKNATVPRAQTEEEPGSMSIGL